MKFSLCAIFFAATSVNAFSTQTAGNRGVSALRSAVDTPPAMARSQTKVPVFDEVCDTTGVTLTRFMNEVAMLNPELRELTTLFGAIDTACKAMTNLVKRSQLPSSETLGYQGEVNIQGEDQKKLDVITNDLLKRALRFTGRLGVLASEEEDVPVSTNCNAMLCQFFRFGLGTIVLFYVVSARNSTRKTELRSSSLQNVMS
jgi:fructose-1,6-bisphosphatase I